MTLEYRTKVTQQAVSDQSHHSDESGSEIITSVSELFQNKNF